PIGPYKRRCTLATHPALREARLPPHPGSPHAAGTHRIVKETGIRQDDSRTPAGNSHRRHHHKQQQQQLQAAGRRGSTDAWRMWKKKRNGLTRMQEADASTKMNETV
ncbi:regulator of sigma E protease, partial [Trypanosoma cruzi]